jgi:hypothetical protein
MAASDLKRDSAGLRRSSIPWRSISVVASAVLLLLSASPDLVATYDRTDLVHVPVKRVIRNVERTLRAAPDDGDQHWALGRLHTIASMEPRRQVATWAQPTFGRPAGQPFLLEKYERFPDTSRAMSADAIRKRDAHLQQALRHYRRASELLPDDLRVRLGLAWTLDQVGQDAEAMRLYRSVYAASKTEEREQPSMEQDFVAVSREAALYLLGHLHPVTDAAEVASLHQHIGVIDRLPRWVTPIVVPARVGLEPADLVDRHARVAFDLDGTRTGHTWEWITPEASWLVWDPRRTGQVRSGLDLFGSVSFWVFWTDGYHALRALDDDGDGWLRGTELDGIALWTDRNSNGISDAGEVTPSHHLHIVAIASHGSIGHDPRVAAYAPVGVVYRDGTSRPTYDLLLGRAAPRLTAREP